MFELIAILGIFFILFFGTFSLALYVVLAYSLYRMAVKQNLENPWIAIIPIAQWYILGKLIKSLKILDYEIPSIEFVLPVASLIVLVFNRVHFLGSVLSLANYILMLFALNKLYKLYKPDSATLYTVLSIFVIPVPFILLSLRNRDLIA